MYDTLAKLPIVIFEEISETGNLQLLLADGESMEPEALAELWQNLSIEFADKVESPESKKNLRLSRDIESFRFKYKAIMISCEALKFDWDNELVAKIRSFGYVITEANYYDDIERIERESKALLVKAANLETMLPKEGKEISIYDVLASYSAILGIDYDFEAVSCLKYLSIQKQVASKIKAAEKNHADSQSKKRR